MSSPSNKIINVDLPRGPLGVTLQQSADNGVCVVSSKTNEDSPLEVGDVILCLNGIRLEDVAGGLRSWEGMLQNCSGDRTLVVQRQRSAAVVSSIERDSDEGNEDEVEHGARTQDAAAAHRQNESDTTSTEKEALTENEPKEREDGFSDFVAFLGMSPSEARAQDVPLVAENAPDVDSDDAPLPDSYIAAMFDEQDDDLMAEIYEKRRDGTSKKIRPELVEENLAPMPDGQSIGTMQVEESIVKAKEQVMSNENATTSHRMGIVSRGKPSPDSAVRVQPSEVSPDDVPDQRGETQDTLAGNEPQVPMMHRPPPPSMLRPPSSSSSAPAAMVEATLVEEDPPLPVCDAVAVRIESDSSDENDDNGESLQPWWKQYHRLVVVALLLFIAALIAIMGVALLGPNNDASENPAAAIDGSSSAEPTIPPQTSSPTSLPLTGPMQNLPPPTYDTVPKTEQHLSTNPTEGPTSAYPPSESPSQSPSQNPTINPTKAPNQSLTTSPSPYPTQQPTLGPTKTPSQSPSHRPTIRPTETLTWSPTKSPSPYPTRQPTKRPSKNPTKRPTLNPTAKPTFQPTQPVQSSDKELISSDFILPHDSTRTVAVHGNTAVVGAPLNDNERGAAFVFLRDGSGQWAQQAKLQAPDGAASDRFGHSVAIHWETIIVGVVWDGTYSGSAHVFVRNGATWTHQAKLLAPDGNANDIFGDSVGIHDDTAIVGAPFDDDNGQNSGSAHVFVRNGVSWTHQAKLLAPDGDEEDRFGGSVGLYGNTAIVGAIYDDHNGLNSGSVHVYVRNGSEWSHQEKLLAPDGAADDQFGTCVGIYDNTVVVGTGNDDDHGSNSGSAHVYVRNGVEWSHQAKLIAPDAAAGDIFGNSVAISTDTIVVGAWGDNVDDVINTGSAHVYVRNGADWTHQAKLLAPIRAEDDDCGLRVAVHSGTVVVGCKGSGKTHVFRV